MHTKIPLPIIGVAVLIIGLFIWGAATANRVTYVPDTHIMCTSEGQALIDHIHPTITVTVDGVPEIVPANLGISPTCLAEIHTHETDGVIHVESIKPGRLDVLTLADFFTIWGKALERPGYTALLKIDGATTTDPASVKFHDAQKIELSYTSLAQ